jgi:hypothetical protein
VSTRKIDVRIPTADLDALEALASDAGALHRGARGGVSAMVRLAILRMLADTEEWMIEPVGRRWRWAVRDCDGRLIARGPAQRTENAARKSLEKVRREVNTARAAASNPAP